MNSTTKKTLLYRTEVEYGDFTINHVKGCAHGCTYPCYAFNMARRFGNVKSYKEWIEPKIVSNAMELLEKELPRYKKQIKSVQLSFTTDPFMVDYPEVGDLSLKIINRLNKENIKVVILTKSILPDELLNTKKINEYGITLVSLDENFRKKYEPFTPSYQERIKALKKLHDAGFYTWVSIEPYPTPNICDQDFKDILNSISFVDSIVFGRLHYNKQVSEYKGYKEFFNECASFVSDFCQKNNIKFHIKKGTSSE